LIGFISDAQGGVIGFGNFAKVQSKGLEFHLAAKWANGVEGQASYNLQRTTDLSSGQVLSNSPLHLAKLGLIVPLVENKVFASLDSSYMGRRRTILGSSVGGFALVNATLLSRNLGKHADLSASLYNVFDKTYADPGGQELLNAVQQDGRNFRVKLTFHF
jgi:iron complex outermembrane receptor protein